MSEKPKVLLVDDEPLVLDSLRAIVSRDEKYHVSIAENGRMALEIAGNENFSVIITDLMLTDITGNELLKSVKENMPETQVIMVSGKGTINLAVESFNDAILIRGDNLPFAHFMLGVCYYRIALREGDGPHYQHSLTQARASVTRSSGSMISTNCQFGMTK